MRITGWIEDHSDYPVETLGEMSMEEMKEYLIENGYVGISSSIDFPEFAFRNEDEVDEVLNSIVEGNKNSTTIEIWDKLGNMRTLHFDGKREII